MNPHQGTSLTPIVGREREVRALESRLGKGARLVTLLGPGGSGKTRLAQALFANLQSRGTDVVYVDLVGLLDPVHVPAAMAADLGISETADLDAAAAVMAALEGRAVTIVLDNLEELTGATDFLARLLGEVPGLQLIATSRIPLRIPGEVEFVVQPLDLPHGDTVAEVEASSAGRLFLERARAIGRLDEFDAQSAIAIARLCRRLDGLPLALELAAARVRIMPPTAILAHLAERTTGLLVKAGEPDRRHESLDAVLRWSLDLLEPNELKVLGAVAICPGGFDLELAQAIAPGLDVLHAFDVLATHGLLRRRDEVENVPWYRLLETIRAAAQARLTESEGREAWALLASYLAGQVAETREAFWRADETVLQRLDDLRDNVRATLDWCESSDPALGLSIASEFHWYWSSRGGSREGVSTLRGFVAANPEPSRALVRALHGWSLLEEDVSGRAESNRLASEACRIARLVGDGEGEILALAERLISSETPDHAAAARIRELLPTVEHPAIRWSCLHTLADAEATLSGYSEETIGRVRDVEAAIATSPYGGLQGIAACNLANMYLHAGMLNEAYAESSRALLAIGPLSPELKVWAYAMHVAAAARTAHLPQSVSSLRIACELTTSRRLTVRPDLLIAALEMFGASNQPLAVARLWAVLQEGEGLDDADRSRAETLSGQARRVSDPVSFALAVLAGHEVSPAQAVAEVLSLLDEPTASRAATGPTTLQHGNLTPRELEVLALVGSGMTDREIGSALFISRKTASVHVSNVKGKLGVETRLDAALRARELGLVGSKGP